MSLTSVLSFHSCSSNSQTDLPGTMHSGRSESTLGLRDAARPAVGCAAESVRGGAYD